jgi:accessory gene regulator protein AgrB
MIIYDILLMSMNAYVLVDVNFNAYCVLVGEFQCGVFNIVRYSATILPLTGDHR